MLASYDALFLLFKGSLKHQNRECKHQRFTLFGHSALFEEEDCWEGVERTGTCCVRRERTSPRTGWLSDLLKWVFNKVIRVGGWSPEQERELQVGRVREGEGCRGDVHMPTLKTACSAAFLEPLYKTCELNFHLHSYILSHSTSIEVRYNFALVL